MNYRELPRIPGNFHFQFWIANSDSKFKFFKQNQKIPKSRRRRSWEFQSYRMSFSR